MRKISKQILGIVLVLILGGCKDNPKKEQHVPVATEKIKKPELPSTLYVIAPSGLILRAKADLDSKRVDKMPYGSAVHITAKSIENNLEVANIPGTMLQVHYKDTTGFAYSGYLVKFPPPKRGENTNRYGARLEKDFEHVRLRTDTVTSENNDVHRLTITLSALSWSEAFLIAKQLYDIPEEFNFPRINGPSESTAKGSPGRKDFINASLTAKRTDGKLSGIIYSERGKNNQKTVKIVKKEAYFELILETTDQ